MTDVPTITINGPGTGPTRTAADVHADLAAAIKDFDAKTAAANEANHVAGEAAQVLKNLRAELTHLESEATSVLQRAEAFIRKHL